MPEPARIRGTQAWLTMYSGIVGLLLGLSSFVNKVQTTAQFEFTITNGACCLRVEAFFAKRPPFMFVRFDFKLSATVRTLDVFRTY